MSSSRLNTKLPKIINIKVHTKYQKKGVIYLKQVCPFLLVESDPPVKNKVQSIKINSEQVTEYKFCLTNIYLQLIRSRVSLYTDPVSRRSALKRHTKSNQYNLSI